MALMHEAVLGQSEIVRELIKAGADVNKADLTGTTALMRAVSGKYNDIIDLLKEAGANK